MPKKRLKKESAEMAMKHLQRARDQYDLAAVHSWEPKQPEDCVTNCFYSYGNAISAAAAFFGFETPDNHYEKAELARELFQQRKLKIDVHDRFLELNELRKKVSYGQPGPELESTDLEVLVSDLEEFLSQVETIVESHSA